MMETLRRSFTLRRLQNIFCIASSIAAGVAALGLIGSPQAIIRTGSASGEDNVSRRVDGQNFSASTRQVATGNQFKTFSKFFHEAVYVPKS